MNKFLNSNLNTSKYQKSNLLIFALLLIGLVVIFSFGVGNASATNVYVNVTGGSNTYDGSSPVHTTGNIGPKKSILDGVNAAPATGGNVFISNGIYNSANDHNIFIGKDIKIKGQSKTGTIIQCPAASWIFTVNAGHTVQISDLTMSNGNVGFGGAIANNGNLKVTNCNFKSNKVTNNGGALYNGATLNVDGCTFTDNSATGNGGAIYNTGSSMLVSQCIFESNSASLGGAIYNAGSTTNNAVTGSSFNGNHATGGNGGAINNNVGLGLLVARCTFTDNTATGNGGGIDNQRILNVDHCTFTDNTASGDGGAIGTMGTLTVYDGSIFTGNIANRGGAIINYLTMNIASSTFLNNIALSTAPDSGGAALFNTGAIPVSVTGSIFMGNTAAFNGGAIDNNGIMTISGCSLNSNSANSVGGAISNYGTGVVTVVSNNLVGNSATAGGGIVNYGTATAYIQFNRISNNIASSPIFPSNDIANVATINGIANNWWGSNSGPLTGDVYGVVVPNWLVLKLSANPTTIGNNALSTIKADLRFNNLGTLAAGNLPNGIPVTFTTTKGTITQGSTVNGIAQSTLKSGVIPGTATVVAKLDGQTSQTFVKIKDTLPPVVTSTNPKNGARGISRSLFINIKFSENITKSINYNKITLKKLNTGSNVSIRKTTSGKSLFIANNTKLSRSTWYIVTIPSSSIRDSSGNRFAHTYTFKFKTKS